MWIRSQDKGYLVKSPIIDIDIKKNEVYILDRTYAKEPFIGRILGVYKSKERALEVLDDIQRYLIPSIDMIGKIPEDGKIYGVNSIVSMVYQMPEE